MAENTLDQIVDCLRSSGGEYFPQHSELKTARVVGHTPRPDHYTYEIVLDFTDGSERVNAKLYRGRNGGRAGQEAARQEAQNLQFAHRTAEKRKLKGVPRPVGDFAELGAVVSTKVNGLPLQSIIMKAALLPGDGNHHLLQAAAGRAGEWLQQFHRATAAMPAPLDGDGMLTEIERLCLKAQKDGLPAESIDAILGNARSALGRHKRPLKSSAVLQEFLPLNVLVAEEGVGFCEFAGLSQSGHSLLDAATFLAAVEVLEKYPFCDRNITALVQDAFVAAYGVGAQEQALLETLKMKVLLQMFAQGRVTRDSAERKKVMWSNVMKRFIQQAAGRSAAKVA
ncbi:MAG TPA: hypothetical protein VL240_08730 [Candidatus Binatia bacterium]|nr:hypothetical protein [Candidatus Binatia bacterium]